jgi:type IV fimbrial biogenesis protein FimT
MKQKGLTLIELMITLTISGIMLASASVMATSYISNSDIRSTANEFQTGLLTAKLEAIKRNSVVRFTPTSMGGWTIDIPALYTETGNIEYLQSKAITSNNVNVAAVDSSGTAVTAISFMWSGRPSTDTINALAFPVTFSFALAGQTCNSAGNTICLNVILTRSGQIQTCNPKARGKYGCS